MRGLYYRLSPFTPDSAGVASLFADISALVIPVDMNGTASTFGRRVGVEEDSPFKMVSVVGNREMSYVLGESQSFLEEFLELDRRFGEDLTILVNGPISAMVGIDLSAMAVEMEEITGKPTLAFDCSGNGSYEEGLSRAMSAVFKRFGSAKAQAEEGQYNVLGLNNVDHNSRQLRRLILDQLEECMGVPALSVWGSEDGPDQWSQAGRASVNVVASACAERLAKEAKRTHGTPCVFIDELPLPCYQEICELQLPGESKPKVLVVSEQLLGNLARRCLEVMGCEVDVASFHMMLASRKREGDFHIDGEWDLMNRVASGGYDLVVGDEALKTLLPEDVAFVPMEHSAVSVMGHVNAYSPPPLSDEWMGNAAEVLKSL